MTDPDGQAKKEHQNIIHGHCVDGVSSRTYKVWDNMRTRGKALCSEWQDFAGFLHDMGEVQDGGFLRIIDDGKDCGPDNCKWADPDDYHRAPIQKPIKRTTALGVSVAELAEYYDATIRGIRLSKGEISSSHMSVTKGRVI